MVKNIQRGGSFLELFVIVVLISYGRSVRPLLPGGLYLVAASYLGLFSLIPASTLLRKQRMGELEPAAWALRRRAYILLLAGWQVAIIGLLNLLQFSFSESWVSIVIGYLSAGIFMILSYKLVAIADDHQQEGGQRPINYFGRPRSRRIFFCGFVYTPIGLLVAFSIVWSDWKLCPPLLRLPQLWLLLTALLSAASAGLIFQRYRVAGVNKALAGKLIAVTFLGLGLAGAIQIFLDAAAPYLYLLSSMAIACTAMAVYWLSLAKENSEA